MKFYVIRNVVYPSSSVMKFKFVNGIVEGIATIALIADTVDGDVFVADEIIPSQIIEREKFLQTVIEKFFIYQVTVLSDLITCFSRAFQTSLSLAEAQSAQVDNII